MNRYLNEERITERHKSEFNLKAGLNRFEIIKGFNKQINRWT